MNIRNNLATKVFHYKFGTRSLNKYTMMFSAYTGMKSQSIMILASILVASFVVANVTAQDLNLLNLLPGDQYEAMEVAEKTPVEIIEMRGFQATTHYVRTPDGYHIHTVHLKNPNIEPHKRKRPVIFNHGFLETSTIFLINSRNVCPLKPKKRCPKPPFFDTTNFNETQFMNGPMLLANNGFDVYLMSMRGTDFSRKHDTLTPDQSEFWAYSLDHFALVDVPAVIEFVRKKSTVSKVGYIGHSQATFSIFALLAKRPHYADKVEPVVALTPVAYFDDISSVLRPLFVDKLTSYDKDDDGPFPSNAKLLRAINQRLCDTGINNIVCQWVQDLISGKGKSWYKGYYSHVFFSSSLRVVRHFGQLVKYKDFMMYDHGKEKNLKVYGTETPPSYQIEKIRSKSLVFVSSKTDALATPKDVEKLRKRLTVPIYKDIFIDRDDYNHMDVIINRESAKLVFGPILEVFETFERKTGSCRKKTEQPPPPKKVEHEPEPHKVKVVKVEKPTKSKHHSKPKQMVEDEKEETVEE